MADFVAVLKKTLDGLSDASPQMREKVYEKARLTIAAKLAAMDPQPPAGVIDRQKRALEEAIAQIEKDYAAPKPKVSDPLSELEDVFASLKNPGPAPAPREPSRPAPPQRPAPVAQTVAPPLPVTTELPRPMPSAEAVDALFADGPEEDDADSIRPIAAAPRRRGGGGRLLVAAIVIIALGAGGYGAWINRDIVESKIQELMASLGAGDQGAAATSHEPAAEPVDPSSPADTAAAPDAPAEAPSAATGEPAAGQDIAAVAPAAEQPAAAQASQKFTQRLNADGTEADAGPAGGTPAVGEGTSVAAVTEPPLATMEPPLAEAPAATPPAATDDAAPAMPADPLAAAQPADPPAEAPAAETPPATGTAAEAPAPDTATPDTAAPAETPPESPAPAAQDTATAPAAPADELPAPTSVQAQSIPVGQRAIFYEERTNVAEASAESGSTVWSLVQESPGGDLPPEPAIRAETTIPGKDVQLRMTIRRNADKSLPASHIVEMIFLTPDGFEGGGIDNVLRISLKGSEQEAGSPLLGIPAKIADGFFLIALNDTKPEIDANTALLGRQSWIDVPVQYKSGRRALFTMEKGIPGMKVFDEAIKAWQSSSSG